MNKFLPLLLLGFLFIGMYVCWVIGHKLGARLGNSDFKKTQHGIGLMEGAVFALMGLLVSFSFSVANIRFDSHRQLVIDEVNAVGTAYLRIKLLPPDLQPSLRESFRRYVDLRLAVYQKWSDLQSATLAVQAVRNQEVLLWRQALAAVDYGNAQAPAMLVLPAINQMFEAASSRTIIASFHMPTAIFLLLVILAFTSAMLAGYDMGRSRRPGLVHISGFIIIVVLTIYTIVDFEYPRLGLIRLNPYDKLLLQQRQQM